MKRLFAVSLFIIMIITFLSSCGLNKEEIQKEFLEILEKPASEVSIEEAGAFLDKYIGKLDKEQASHMVIAYENYIISYDQKSIDYKDWIDKYERNIHQSVVDLYKIKQIEQETPMSKDGTLSITIPELLDRAYSMEEYIENNKKEHLIKEDATWIYGNYINALVMGTSDSPVFDYKNNEFSEEARNEYAIFINKYPDSATAWVLTEYFTYLESVNYKVDYNDKVSSKLYFDTCNWLVLESGKRVFQ